MMSAVLTALAVWFAVARSTAERPREVFGPARHSAHLNLAMIAGAVVPFAAVVLLGWPTGALIGLIGAPLAYRAVGQLGSAVGRQRASRIAAQLGAVSGL